MSLTAEQIADFRNDIADQNEAFAEEEIQRLYQRAGSYDAVVVLAIEQLLAGVAKFNDYSMGMSEEESHQAFNNLQDLLEIKRERAQSNQRKSSVRLVRLGRAKRRGDRPYHA